MILRHLERSISRSLRDTPVVLVNGARQTGKTTLVRSIASKREGTRYVTLDDAATLSAAQTDPIGFIDGLGEYVVLDEVQKAPDLFPALKVAVDRRRKSGRFLLTGSADVLAMPTLSESLAGRMEPLVLWPLSQGEIAGVEEFFVGAMFASRPARPVDSMSERKDVLNRAMRGGYPSAFRRSEARRRDWFAAYVTTILQRDVRDLADIEHLSAMPRILSLIAARAGALLNTSELSRTSGLPNSTLQRYLALLEHTFLVHLIPAWSSNRSKRLIKTPKVALVDTALLAHLAGITSRRMRREPGLVGPLLENFVAVELWKQIGWSSVRVQVFHFRTHGGREVDLVLEADDGRLVGIEVKASATISGRDFAGLETLREIAGSRFHRGVVLYTGMEVLPFGRRMFALPLSALWDMSVSRSGAR
jgi:predicted AAA+ superfamily ATPase